MRKKEGGFLLGEFLTLTVNADNSLDGTAPGPVSVEICCGASGEFGPLGQEFERIKCGVESYKFVESMKLIWAVSGSPSHRWAPASRTTARTSRQSWETACSTPARKAATSSIRGTPTPQISRSSSSSAARMVT